MQTDGPKEPRLCALHLALGYAEEEAKTAQAEIDRLVPPDLSGA